MNTIEVLRKLINIYYYLLLLVLVGIVIFIVTIFQQGETVDLKVIEGYNTSSLSTQKLIVITAVLVVIYILFVRAIYLLKGTLKELSEGNYFSELITENFKMGGKLILICGVSYAVFKFVIRLLLLGDIRFGIDFSLITPIIIGLFFMFLSEVFTKARKTQEENDLTI
ncbi:Protein of unknown function [Hyunsoonleella jejuensis]|uniref:DUF2975 domain-containing protein n=1 Tax=Hyunsoonleella jejuensis TaxID=419940 RepID=A0A1H9AP00_9FLAO|nr:DUF2975 domain-containing protein [Hyunsoonleella jejuensis]SEP78093.1 Protein of unknown function [Hyunsoonleella jejuensis]